MEKREFYRIILNHFLIVSKSNNDIYSISDYKLRNKSYDLEFRSSNSKILLDNLNPVNFPVILGLKLVSTDVRVLYSMENVDSLSLSISDNIVYFYSNLRKIIKKEIPVIDLYDLKRAMKSDKLVIPVYFAKVNLRNKVSIKSLKEILLKKLTMF